MHNQLNEVLNKFTEQVSRLKEKQFSKGKTFRDLGLSDGGENRPSTKANDLGQVETELVTSTTGLLRDLKNMTEVEVNEIENSMEISENEIRRTDWQSALSELPAETRSKVESVLSAKKTNLITLSTYSLESLASLRRFKRDNHLHHEPSYPESKQAHYFWIAIIGIVEVILNAFFYNEFTGFLDGIFLAGMISVVIVSIAVIAGNFWRMRNSINVTSKLLGWGSFLGWFCFTHFFVKLIAFFRHFCSLGNPFPEATKLAFEVTFNSPVTGFSEISIQTWLLFIVSWIVAVVAFYKGYSADDMYPGFGDAHRFNREAETNLQVARDELHQEIDSIITEARDSLSSVSKEKQAHYKDFMDGIRALNKLQATADFALSEIHDGFRHDVEAYRHANRAARSTDTPQYFLQMPSLPKVSIVRRPTSLEKCSSEYHIELQSILAEVNKLSASTSSCLTGVEREIYRLLSSYEEELEAKAKDVIAERNRIGSFEERAA